MEMRLSLLKAILRRKHVRSRLNKRTHTHTKTFLWYLKGNLYFVYTKKKTTKNMIVPVFLNTHALMC